MPFPNNQEITKALLKVLADLGGAAQPQQIYPKVAEYFPQLTAEDLEATLPSSPSTYKWRNKVQWVRQNLVMLGCIDGTEHGVWKITEKGRELLGQNPPTGGVLRLSERAGDDSLRLENAEIAPLFSDKTFQLLESLHQQPTQAFYKEHKDEFNIHLEIPLAKLFQKVAKRLPDDVAQLLEMENRILGRIPKNDYGQGGAWDFLWGAFYPRGGRRREDGQLFITVDHVNVKYGFSVADYGKPARQRFASRMQAMPADLVARLKGW